MGWAGGTRQVEYAKLVTKGYKLGLSRGVGSTCRGSQTLAQKGLALEL